MELRQRAVMTTREQSMDAASGLSGYQRFLVQMRREPVPDARNLAAVLAFSIAGIVLSIGFALADPQSTAIVALAAQSP